jgi:hypothetical protein
VSVYGCACGGWERDSKCCVNVCTCECVSGCVCVCARAWEWECACWNCALVKVDLSRPESSSTPVRPLKPVFYRLSDQTQSFPSTLPVKCGGRIERKFCRGQKIAQLQLSIGKIFWQRFCGKYFNFFHFAWLRKKL